MSFGKQKNVTEVDYNELERLLLEHFPGVQPDLIAREEWNNYEEHSFDADGQLDQYDTEKLAKYIAGEWTQWGTTQVLLNALVLKGAIPAGTYLVSIFW